MAKAKITKLMLWPNRKFNLGNYETIDLNAGVEVAFDKPVSPDSKEVKETLDEMRKIIKDEFGIQIEPYKKLLMKMKGGEKNGQREK